MRLKQVISAIRLAVSHPAADWVTHNESIPPLEQVGALRSAITPQVDKLWNVLNLVKTADGRITFDQYAEYNLKLQKAINPACTDTEADSAAHEDWRRDVRRSGSGGELDLQGFTESMLELCGCWADAHTGGAYREFLGAVLQGILIDEDNNSSQSKRRWRHTSAICKIVGLKFRADLAAELPPPPWFQSTAPEHSTL